MKKLSAAPTSTRDKKHASGCHCLRCLIPSHAQSLESWISQFAETQIHSGARLSIGRQSGACKRRGAKAEKRSNSRPLRQLGRGEISEGGRQIVKKEKEHEEGGGGAAKRNKKPSRPSLFSSFSEGRERDRSIPTCWGRPPLTGRRAELKGD
ncbi:hypothetical protein MTO96_016715 [Rhipicephalus appendiculatus]